MKGQLRLETGCDPIKATGLSIKFGILYPHIRLSGTLVRTVRVMSIANSSASSH